MVDGEEGRSFGKFFFFAFMEMKKNNFAAAYNFLFRTNCYCIVTLIKQFINATKHATLITRRSSNLLNVIRIIFRIR